MIDQKEAYHYGKFYMPKLEGAKINLVPGISYIKQYSLPKNTPYTFSEYLAKEFIQEANNPSRPAGIDDFFKQKIYIQEDRIGLVLGEIESRESLKYQNLKSLYEDLLKVQNWRLERPFPQNYAKDKTWSDLNRMHLQLMDQIRRELKDSARDVSFPNKDLRESLLEFKLQKNKNRMMEGGLEMELDSSTINSAGDSYQPQPLY